MIVPSATFGNKHFALLGKLLLQKEPEVAKRLITAYLPNEEPLEQDFTKIQGFFISFCQIKDIEPEDYTGPLYKTSKVDVRRLFVAAIIRMYAPMLYSQPADAMVLSYGGIVKALSSVLKCDRGNISSLIRQVITWEKNYQDFSESAALMVKQLTNAGQKDK